MSVTWQIYPLPICMKHIFWISLQALFSSEHLDFLMLKGRHPNLFCGPFESVKPSSRPMSAYDNRHIKRRKVISTFFASAFHVKVLLVRRWEQLLRAPGGCGEGSKCVPGTEVCPGRTLQAESGSASAAPIPTLHTGQYAPWKPRLSFTPKR